MAYGVGTWAANAYNLKFDPSTVNPSNGPHARWYGFPVRVSCRGSVPISYQKELPPQCGGN